MEAQCVPVSFPSLCVPVSFPSLRVPVHLSLSARACEFSLPVCACELSLPVPLIPATHGVSPRGVSSVCGSMPTSHLC